MKNDIQEPESLQEAIVYFSNPDNAFNYAVAHRWSDGVIPCPVCGRTDATFLKNQRKWQCRSHHSFRQFSVKTGTIFEDSPLGLDKWLTASWMICNCKNGVSSYEIHRALKVTQKTAWFMLHRVRASMHTGSFMVKLGGSGKEVEVDETFIGGKARNMHKSVKARRITGQGHNVDDKAIVMGILERGKGQDKKNRTASKVRATVITDRTRDTLHPLVKEHVTAGTALYSDELTGYMGLEKDYNRGVVDHASAYVDGKVHTNGMENFWSLLKRGLGGTYVSVEPFHLFRYIDEQVFRFNNRATKVEPINDGDRLRILTSQFAGKRLTYKELTGKTEEEQVPF